MQKGAKHTEEAKEKNRQANLGRPPTRGRTGMKNSEFAKQKQAEGMRAYWAKKKGEQQ